MGACHNEDAEGAVLVGRSCGLEGEHGGTEVIGVKPVVGEEDDRRVLSCEFEEPAEHHVVEAVGCCHDALIAFERLVGDPRLLRGMEPHEPVVEVVNGVEVDRHEVPLRVLHCPRRRLLDRGGLRERLRDEAERLVALRDLGRQRHERK